MMDDVKNADSDYDNMSSQESLPEAEPLEAQPQNNGSEQLGGQDEDPNENDDPDQGGSGDELTEEQEKIVGKKILHSIK